MKNLLAVIGLIVVILVGGYFILNSDDEYTPPDGYVLISEAEMDSLQNLEPKIVVEDSIVYKDKIVYKDRPIPEPEPTDDPEVQFYPDSIINDSTYLVIHDWVRGEIVKRNIELRRAVQYTEIRVPYPKFIETTKFIERPDPWFIYADVEGFGNANNTIVGGELGFITRSNYKIGLKYATDLDTRYIGVSIGYTFRFR